MLYTNVRVSSFFMILYVVRNDEIKKGSIMSSFSHGKIDWVSLTAKDKGLTRLCRSVTDIDLLSWSPFWSHQWHKTWDTSRWWRQTGATCQPSMSVSQSEVRVSSRESSRQICTSYRKISWCLEAPRFGFILSNRSDIWPRQQCCRDACQIWERYDHYNIQSLGFKTSWHLVVRRLTA